MSTESASPVDQFKAFEQHKQILVAGIAIAIVSAFLPWASIGTISVSGIDGDGVFSLLLAAAAAGAIYYEGWTEQVMLVCVALGAGVTLVALSNHGQYATYGLYLTAVGGIAMAAGAYQQYDQLQ